MLDKTFDRVLSDDEYVSNRKTTSEVDLSDASSRNCSHGTMEIQEEPGVYEEMCQLLDNTLCQTINTMHRNSGNAATADCIVLHDRYDTTALSTTSSSLTERKVHRLKVCLR